MTDHVEWKVVYDDDKETVEHAIMEHVLLKVIYHNTASTWKVSTPLDQHRHSGYFNCKEHVDKAKRAAEAVAKIQME